jgi:hypothetical protein
MGISQKFGESRVMYRALAPNTVPENDCVAVVLFATGNRSVGNSNVADKSSTEAVLVVISTPALKPTWVKFACGCEGCAGLVAIGDSTLFT